MALARSWGLGRAFSTSLAERPSGAHGVNLAYGETPWGAMRTILSHLALTAEDTFLELGSGTGRFSLIAARLTGCRAIGIELVPSFVERANAIASRLAMKGCEFREQDFFDVSWREASAVYCATTTFDDATLARFEDKCRELPRGARVVTVTQPPRTRGLALEWMEVLDFSWGPGTVFLHRSAAENARASR